MKTFDDLFNEFFKRNNIKPEDNLGDAIRDEAKKMIDMLSNFSQFQNIDDLEDEIEKTIDSLGKPDKIEFFNEGEMFFERRTWHTPKGDLVKLIVSDDPSLINTPKFEKPLEEQLKEAVENEEYEKAAAIRDKMNGKKTRKSKKK